MNILPILSFYFTYTTCRAYVSLADFQNLASQASESGIKVASQSDMWLNCNIGHFALQVR